MADWTEERERQALARCEATTPGVWLQSHFIDAKRYNRWSSEDKARAEALERCRVRPNESHQNALLVFAFPEDAAFAAHAHQDLPDAIAELQRLRQRAETAERERNGAIGALWAIEWTGPPASPEGEPTCPRCGALKSAGHAEHCVVGHVMRSQQD